MAVLGPFIIMVLLLIVTSPANHIIQCNIPYNISGITNMLMYHTNGSVISQV